MDHNSDIVDKLVLEEHLSRTIVKKIAGDNPQRFYNLV
ncbi:hypothetical protein [Cylindrospermum stagnale]|nr:hypothetical protein [Cylindrospermum stagnale]